MCVGGVRGGRGCIWATAEPSNPFQPFSPSLSLQHRPGGENPLWPERKAELGPVVHSGLFIGSNTPLNNPQLPASHTPPPPVHTDLQQHKHTLKKTVHIDTHLFLHPLLFFAVSHLISLFIHLLAEKTTDHTDTQ